MVDQSPVLPSAVIKDACLIVTLLLLSFISGTFWILRFLLRGGSDFER